MYSGSGLIFLSCFMYSANVEGEEQKPVCKMGWAELFLRN